MTYRVLILLCAASCPLYATASLGAENPAPPPTFDVFEYRVLGDTSLLEQREVERSVYPHMGQTKTFDDVEQARAGLERAYRAAGYGTVFVDIPEQAIDDGVVRLRVTQGRLDRVRVTGARYFSGRALIAELPAARPGSAPHLPTLQEQLGRLNVQSRDRSVVPVLKSGSAPGMVDLELKVADNLPLHASVEVNDQQTASTSRLRANVSFSYENLFQRFDALALQYQTAPAEPSEVGVFAASYSARLSGRPTTLALFYINSNSDVATLGDAGGNISVLGRGKIYGTRLILPLQSDASASHTLNIAAEYKDFTESVFAEDLLLTPISYLNLSLGQSSAWRGERVQWGLSNSLHFGVRGLGNESDEFRDKRFRARPNYIFMRSEASIGVPLPGRFAVQLRLAGQYAVDSIISNEQFSIAGADGVRGYFEAEQLGDVGVKSSVELQLPELTLWGEHAKARPFLFHDFGRMTRLNPLRRQDPRTLELLELLEEPNHSLHSAGVGLGYEAFEHVSGSISWAYPFLDGGPNGGTRAGDSRFHFLMRASW